MFNTFLHTNNSKTTILIRLMVGAVFLSEGIQKLLFPDTPVAGRFAKIGLPSPGFLGSFVDRFEIVCGALVLGSIFLLIEGGSFWLLYKRIMKNEK